MKTKDKRLTIERVAEAVHISPQVLRIHAQEGNCPYIKAVKGKKRYFYYINEMELKNWYGEDILKYGR